MDEYQQQANNFCDITNTIITAQLSNTKKPEWETDSKNKNKHFHYIVNVKNNHGQVTFDYFGSVADWEKVNTNPYGYTVKSKLLEKIKPDNYSILACLSAEYTDDIFEDWCYNYGCDSDSVGAKKIYDECITKSIQLRKMYTSDEINKLLEIN